MASTGLAEKRYILPGLIVFGGSIIAYFVGVLPAGGEAASAYEQLKTRHAAVQAAQAQPGGPISQGHLNAAAKAREGLQAQHDQCAQFFQAADAELESYFDEYEGKRDLANPTSFKREYQKATRALAGAAAAFAARDEAGQPVTPFVFKTWPVPSANEIQPAQKEFWIQRAMLDVVRAVSKEVKLRSVRVNLPDYLDDGVVAHLPTLGVTPTDADRWTHWQWIETTLEVELPAPLVEAFLAECLAPPAKKLITELRQVRVRSAAKLTETVSVKVKKGEQPNVNVDDLEPNVILTVRLAVLDPPTSGRAQ